MGGDWDRSLPVYLSEAQQRGYRTCLYTGRELHEISPEIVKLLDYCKTGKWEGKTLKEKGSNQKFWKLPEMQDWSYKFRP